MFGFGRSAELDRREQALNMREQELNQREFDLRKLEYSLRVQEQKLSAMELKLENQITEATKTRDKYQAERQMLLYTREEKLANADKQAAKIVANAQKEAESLCLKGYQEGKLKGLQSGQKSYWDMEKERDAALKKASNARHAAIRRQRKALRAPKPITLFSNK